MRSTTDVAPGPGNRGNPATTGHSNRGGLAVFPLPLGFSIERRVTDHASLSIELT
jgi:hypothetical protein